MKNQPVKDKIIDQNSPSENLIREQLFDGMVMMFAWFSGIMFALTQVRAFEIGWTARDVIYFIIFIGINGIAFCRRKLSSQFKAFSIILISVTIGVVGSYTMGMISGAVFLFELAAVVISLFYSKRAVFIYGGLVIVFLSFITIGFTSNHFKVIPTADLLHTNAVHWCTYILSFILFFLVACLTILKYRQAMRELIENVNYQRDKLNISNKNLQRALDEIKTLRGILPICSFCKKIRDDKGYWEQVDVYIKKYSEADVSHGICPECVKANYPEFYASIMSKKEKPKD